MVCVVCVYVGECIVICVVCVRVKERQKEILLTDVHGIIAKCSVHSFKLFTKTLYIQNISQIASENSCRSHYHAATIAEDLGSCLLLAADL